MNIRVLIISDNEEACAAYRRAAESAGACCDSVSSLADIHRALVQTPYNGLLLDVVTGIKASHSERARVQDILEIFPTIRLKRGGQGENVRALLFSTNQGISVEEFITSHCLPFNARGIRRNPRIGLHFNVLLSPREDFPAEDTEKTVTMDIARGGCFLYSTRRWEGTETAWIQILEFEERTPIRVEICRHIPWGKSLAVPGIGAKFAGLSAGQTEAIRLMLDSRPATLS